MNGLIFFILCFYISILGARCCDEFSVQEVRIAFDNCVNGTLNGVKQYDNGFCDALDELVDCSYYFSICTDNYYEEAEIRLNDLKVFDDVSRGMAMCLKRRRKRSPGGTNGGGGRSGGTYSGGGWSVGGSSSSGSSSSSRSSSNRGGAYSGGGWSTGEKISGSTSSQSGSSNSGGSRQGGFRTKVTDTLKKAKDTAKGILGKRKEQDRPVSKKSKKKEILKKVAGVAVVGLAAYGTYKVAKGMAKALKHRYDDDNCWKYNPFTDRYNCICDEKCNVYVGAAPISAAFSVVCIVPAIVLAVWNNRGVITF